MSAPTLAALSPLPHPDHLGPTISRRAEEKNRRRKGGTLLLLSTRRAHGVDRALERAQIAPRSRPDRAQIVPRSCPFVTPWWPLFNRCRPRHGYQRRASGSAHTYGGGYAVGNLSSSSARALAAQWAQPSACLGSGLGLGLGYPGFGLGIGLGSGLGLGLGLG